MTPRLPVVTVAAVLLGVLASCSISTSDIRQYGSTRDVLREGRTEPRVRLVDVIYDGSEYAVGALAGLEGEITMVEGETWIARVVDGELVVKGPGVLIDEQASLLTVASVLSWMETSVDETAGGAALESLIAARAGSAGIDTSEPFPFVIKGPVSRLELHVISGFCPQSADPTATMARKPWRLSIQEPAEVIVVGFYAEGAEGWMTHHGSSTHMHAVLKHEGRTITGHIDDVTVDAGCMLRLSPQGVRRHSRRDRTPPL